jgi:two-component system sensor histidine kinase UhpB
MNLRFRLNLIVTLVLLVVLAIAAAKAVHNARQNVNAEVSSTMALAMHMLDSELANFNHASLDQPLDFKLERLSGVRHLHIAFYNNHNQLLESNEANIASVEADVPAWFRSQMLKGMSQTQAVTLPVHYRDNKIGKLVISPEPGNEIVEAWEETETLIGLIALFFVTVNLLVYFAVKIALKPIDTITDALTAIETGNLDRRLPIFKLPELASISRKFNVMATALQTSTRNNHRLTQQIIRLQEAERKSLAHELHDEIGQHLTAIHVDASAIRSCHDLTAAKQSALAIDSVVRQMMDIVRSMLQQLRPGGLDELGFRTAVEDLVDNWTERHPNIAVSSKIEGALSDLGEDVQLTFYRVLQECLTNISRHAAAEQVTISLVENPNGLELTVVDDGRGFSAERYSQRFGLAGMQERVDSIGGELNIKSEIDQGVTVTVKLIKQGENQWRS